MNLVARMILYFPELQVCLENHLVLETPEHQ